MNFCELWDGIFIATTQVSRTQSALLFVEMTQSLYGWPYESLNTLLAVAHRKTGLFDFGCRTLAFSGAREGIVASPLSLELETIFAFLVDTRNELGRNYAHVFCFEQKSVY